MDSTAAKGLTEELSLAAQEIVNASHRLQKEFAHLSEIAESESDEIGYVHR